jgi:hypothetical protein
MHKHALLLVCLLSAPAFADGEAPATAAPATAPAGAPAPVAAPAPAAASLGVVAEKPAQNALYAELGGNSGWYSLNYERYLRPDAAIRVGFSYMSITASAGTGMNNASASATWATLPIMFDYLGLSSGGHTLELGAGVNMMYFGGTSATFDATAMSSGVIPVGTATIGYRYSAPSGGFVFRAGYTPLFFVTTETKQVFHWGGMSFGYRF